MGLASTLAGVFFITTFFSILAILIIFRIAGKTFRQYIKSKFGLWKKKGAWMLIFDKKRKVDLKFVNLPDNNKVLIKSGDIPEEDQYANIDQVYHQLDKSGNPVILAMEDLPFTFFLKKHNLQTFFPTINNMINIIDNVILSGDESQIDDLENKIKVKFMNSRDNLKYIPDAWKEYQSLMNLDTILDSNKTERGEEISKMDKLLKYKTILQALKKSIVAANNQIVNVYDLFETVGFVKNITKMAFSEYQNGFLASRQTNVEKKSNKMMLWVTIIIGVFVLIGIYMTYSQNEDLQAMQSVVKINSTKVDNLYKYINPEYDSNTNTIVKPTNKTITNGVVETP
jgi:hypothetical protein